MDNQIAVIIGAGPAGLTTAYELQARTSIHPIILEMDGVLGGISKTVKFGRNRIDIGGHRFFSKSSRILDWWQKLLPIQGAPARDDLMLKREVPLSSDPEAPDPEQTDLVMLIRSRLSRILFLRKFFDYPLRLNLQLVGNLGARRTLRIGCSYLGSRLAPIGSETNLEDFFINRFGRELYLTFFKDYTEKVWGVPCTSISPEWGVQRVKGLSVTKAVVQAMRSLVHKDISLEQKTRESSLIDQFMYPKFGPGQIWERVGELICAQGGEIKLHHRVTGVKVRNGKLEALTVRDLTSKTDATITGDYFFSTMPVKEFIAAIDGDVPDKVRTVAEGLPYRDFMTVGLLVRKLAIRNQTTIRTLNGIIPDNWIYIQEKDVKLGRLQIFNNWSPYLVEDPNTICLGLEYFCEQDGELWSKSDYAMTEFAIKELVTIGLLEHDAVLDSIVLRVPKAYPAYFGSYRQFDLIRRFADNLENLYLIGRNGMHRYNNTDHSMLTAMLAVDAIVAGERSRAAIWEANTEESYHEE